MRMPVLEQHVMSMHVSTMMLKYENEMRTYACTSDSTPHHMHHTCTSLLSLSRMRCCLLACCWSVLVHLFYRLDNVREADKTTLHNTKYVWRTHQSSYVLGGESDACGTRGGRLVRMTRLLRWRRQRVLQLRPVSYVESGRPQCSAV